MICFALLILFVLMHSLLDAVRLPDPPVFTGVQHYPCICYLPPDSGLCSTYEAHDAAALDETTIVDKKDKLLVRYYFDAITEHCYPFGVQECGGNANRFENLSLCQNFCTKHK